MSGSGLRCGSLRAALAALALITLIGSPAAASEPPAPRGETATAAASAIDGDEDEIDPAEREKAARLEAVFATDDGFDRRDRAEATQSLGWAFLQMVVVLGAVCLLAYLILGKALPKLMRIQPPSASRRVLEVVDRLPIDQRRSLMVVKIASQYFLIGASEGGISLLSKLEADDVESALAASEPRSLGIGRLASLLFPRSQKEG